VPIAESAQNQSPARGVTFVIDPRVTLGYRIARLLVRTALRLWCAPHITGKEHVPTEGPAILAPVHRSLVDFAFATLLSDRKLFFMAKDQLWRNKLLGIALLRLGVFPVHRESADRQSLQRAQQVLERGQLLVMFPEGGRQEGVQVGTLLEGAMFLAARTDAVMVPIGIGGSDVVLPKGSKLPRPCTTQVVVAPALTPPVRRSGVRVSRAALADATESLQMAIQDAYDESLSRL
jgi:1-acyl-sn-glycerol-3-phosphate acyltransferase